MELDQSFVHLRPDERQNLLSGSMTLHFSDGDTVITEGERIGHLLVVSAGMVRVTKQSENGNLSEFVAPLGPGEIVGELSFVDREGASATLVADGDVTLISIDPAAIDDMAQTDPTFFGRFYKDLLLHLARRLRATNIRVTTTI